VKENIIWISIIIVGFATAILIIIVGFTTAINFRALNYNKPVDIIPIEECMADINNIVGVNSKEIAELNNDIYLIAEDISLIVVEIDYINSLIEKYRYKDNIKNKEIIDMIYRLTVRVEKLEEELNNNKFTLR